jgi:hypothetical protein
MIRTWAAPLPCGEEHTSSQCLQLCERSLGVSGGRGAHKVCSSLREIECLGRDRRRAGLRRDQTRSLKRLLKSTLTTSWRHAPPA